MKPAIADFSVPQAKMHIPRYRAGKTGWQDFFEKNVHDVFEKGGLIVDIGGGLRIAGDRGNRINPENQKLFGMHLHDPRVRYHVTDYTDKYHPDSTQDIHAMTFESGSVDGLFCLAILEHVYDPKKAAEEIMRVLKKGGCGFLYVPFIYRYHANVTVDYLDYYRYSRDAIAYLFRDCESVEICPVRGLFESLLRFTPLHSVPGLAFLMRVLDWSSKKMRDISCMQTSGYFIRITR